MGMYANGRAGGGAPERRRASRRSAGCPSPTPTPPTASTPSTSPGPTPTSTSSSTPPTRWSRRRRRAVDRFYRHDSHTQALMPLDVDAIVAVAPADADVRRRRPTSNGCGRSASGHSTASCSTGAPGTGARSRWARTGAAAQRPGPGVRRRQRLRGAARGHGRRDQRGRAVTAARNAVLNAWTEAPDLCNTSRLRRGALRERRGALMRYKLSIPTLSPRRHPPRYFRSAPWQ